MHSSLVIKYGHYLHSFHHKSPLSELLVCVLNVNTNYMCLYFFLFQGLY